MKKISIVLGILLLLSLIYHGVDYLSHDNSKTYNVETDHKVNLVDIKHIGKVEILNYEFNDVVTHKMIRDYLPDASVTLSINSNAIVCVDLTYITNNDIKIKNDTLYVRLPKPKISNLYINHSKSRVIYTEYTFFDSVALIDSAYTISEKNISDIVNKYHILDSVSVNSPGCKYIQTFIERVSSKPVKLYF
jgi:hypothetical protein